MEEYIFTKVSQYYQYLAKNTHKLNLAQIKELNRIISKSTKLGDKEGCKLLKEFCDKVKLHDYYIF